MNYYSLEDTIVKWKYLKENGKGRKRQKRVKACITAHLDFTWPGRGTLNLLSLLKLAVFSRPTKIQNPLYKCKSFF